MYALRVTKKRERAARSMLGEFEGLSRLLSLPRRYPNQLGNQFLDLFCCTWLPNFFFSSRRRIDTYFLAPCAKISSEFFAEFELIFARAIGLRVRAMRRDLSDTARLGCKPSIRKFETALGHRFDPNAVYGMAHKHLGANRGK